MSESKRTIIPPLPVLEELAQNHEDALREILDIDPNNDDFCNNEIRLHELSTSIKTKLDVYVKTSRLLASQLISCGSISKVFELRSVRKHLYGEASEVILLINSLKVNLNADCESILSGYESVSHLSSTANKINPPHFASSLGSHSNAQNIETLESKTKSPLRTFENHSQHFDLSAPNESLRSNCNRNNFGVPIVNNDCIDSVKVAPPNLNKYELPKPQLPAHLPENLNVSRVGPPDNLISFPVGSSMPPPYSLASQRYSLGSSVPPPLSVASQPFTVGSSVPPPFSLASQRYSLGSSVPPPLSVTSQPFKVGSSVPPPFSLASQHYALGSSVPPPLSVASQCFTVGNSAPPRSSLAPQHFPVGNTLPYPISVAPQPFSVGSSVPPPFSASSQPFFAGSSAPPPIPHHFYPLSNQSSDATSRHLLRLELFRKSSDCFSGEPHKYHTWVTVMNHKIRGLDLDPWDILTIIQVNTSGKPHKVVENHMAIGGADPHQTLTNVWNSLYEQFGSGPQIAISLSSKLDSFPQIKSVYEGEKLTELICICQLIQCNMSVAPELQVYNLSVGIRKVWLKLPDPLQNAWRSVTVDYKSRFNGNHPPFNVFVDFLTRKSKEYCDPCYVRSLINQDLPKRKDSRNVILKTETDPESKSRNMTSNPVSIVNVDSSYLCILHPSGKHETSDCKVFSKLSHADKRSALIEHGRCFRCFGKHLQSNCDVKVSCNVCNGPHNSAMHRDKPNHAHFQISRADKGNTNICTKVCGDQQSKSCSKVLLVDLSFPAKSKAALRCYCIVDEQSSTSFVDPKVVEHFNLSFPVQDYTLTTLSGLNTSSQGMLVEGLFVKGVKERSGINLPVVLTNDSIPNSKNEIAAPNIVRVHHQISHFAKHFPNYDESAEVLILIGRDCGQAMATKCYGQTAPYAHRTPLGWALVGSVCSGTNNSHSVLKIQVNSEHFAAEPRFAVPNDFSKPCVSSLFDEFPDDELPGRSRDDNRFLTLLNEGIHLDSNCNITMPLPFREDSQCFPDNRQAVYNRSSSTLRKLKTCPLKLEKCVAAMEKNIDAGHVEVVPVKEIVPNTPGKVWFIPVFPVTHPKKDKIRLVFDSSACYHGTCLNNELLQGPDINNQLASVLTKFRNGEIGFSADIEAMFHSFYLLPEDKDYTRFFWWKNNDPADEIIQYRARVHIFGNRSSPALANFGLRHAINRDQSASIDTRAFIHDNFYVDDGCGCSDSEEKAIFVLTETLKVLEHSNIFLHKISSSSKEVLLAFPPAKRANPDTIIDFGQSQTHHTLGIEWETSSDHFVVHTSVPSRPFTKRGVLATINSTFDPLGFVCPFILAGRLIQRLLIPSKKNNPTLAALDWDDPLPLEHERAWKDWKSSLRAADGLIKIPRGFYPIGFSPVIRQTLHSFADASILATGYVIYICSVNHNGDVHVSFVTGCSRIAPQSAPSIPRLELCAALDAALASYKVAEELSISPSDVHLYSDSKIVLGYLNNNSKRFSKYVTRRINLITKLFNCSQWSYVATDSNPADIASRPCYDHKTLLNSIWLFGPPFLWQTNIPIFDFEPVTDLPETESLPVLKTISVFAYEPLSNICLRVSDWLKVIRIAKIALTFATNLRLKVLNKNNQVPSLPADVSLDFAAQQVISSVQRQYLSHLFQSLGSNSRNDRIPKNVLNLSPFSEDGIIRVGGRLHNSHLSHNEKHPILVPSVSPLSSLLIDYYHVRTKHQGRSITLSAIRQAGYFIQNGSSLIKKFLNKCILCRKLRGSFLEQKMSTLPCDRLHESPPFTFAGMDAFGPYTITDGASTRRTNATKKTWAIIFTCLVSRAIHVEPLPNLSTPAFINALRRFFSIRGACRILRSDAGTNFVGAYGQEQISLPIDQLQSEAVKFCCKWEMNPPKASHFGGAWERKIGSIKRILDFSMKQLGPRALSRDEFHTFLLEASAIINNTPLCEISADPNEPLPISPAMLLTLHDNPNPAPLQSFSSDDINAYGIRRWKRVQALSDQFWSRWRREYVQTLQARRKWTSERRSLQSGDIVLLKDRSLKRNHWPLARVSAIKTSSDGLVRSVTLVVPPKDDKSKPRAFVRPITDLILVLANDS